MTAIVKDFHMGLVSSELISKTNGFWLNRDAADHYIERHFEIRIPMEAFSTIIKLYNTKPTA